MHITNNINYRTNTTFDDLVYKKYIQTSAKNTGVSMVNQGSYGYIFCQWSIPNSILLWKILCRYHRTGIAMHIVEHQRNCRLWQPENFIVVEHALSEEGHNIMFQDAKLLALSLPLVTIQRGHYNL